jgi:hypothetical protein
MITERAIINFLIIAASFVLVPFIIYSSLTSSQTVEYLPGLVFCGIILLIISFFYLKDSLCYWPMIASGCTGALNFLPLPLQATHVFCILLILYYITGYVAIRQQSIKLGYPKFWVPIAIVALIVLYHNHSLSLGAFGGTTEGAKPAILLLLVVLTYFCAINIKTPPVDILNKLPLYYVIMVAVSNIPYFVTTVAPSLAPMISKVYGNVNVEAYFEDVQGGSDPASEGIGRFSALGAISGSLQIYLLAYYPIGTWLRPNRWWVAGLSVLCLVMASANGFRSVMFCFMMYLMVGSWCYYSYRALVLPIAAGVALLVVVAAADSNVFNLHTNKLPMIVQRTLSFLPLQWDQVALDSATNSNEFRLNIERVYIKEYLLKSPFIGNGFNIDRAEYDAWRENLDGATRDMEYMQAKVFIIGKIFHTGWLSVYDAVGLIGSAAFVVLGFNEIWFVSQYIFGARTNRKSLLFPFYVWLMCNITVSMIAFFTVFGDFGQTFQTLCVYAVVLSHLYDIERTTDVPTSFTGPEGRVEFPGLRGAYGYRYRQ